MDSRSNVITVDNETTSSFTRSTADGRSLTYTLTVIQQPERARACGQGAKSSADRRPVDPPPIVELTIFQGDKREEDITFTMNANYFLFAELEQARPMAQGRISQERSTPPVLTGSPVAGMVYLDRPKPAGYFIFPDLSVRHEGKYRLSFSLYEELKNLKDDDKADDASLPSGGGGHHATHRLDVRSQPFHVYSAKKFPGLTESTPLSRMVAEQGCRVRIRRDVRMRRREPKGGSKDWDQYEDETAAARARQQSCTPDPSIYPMGQPSQGYVEQIPRPRSVSNVSHPSAAGALSRRTSLHDVGQAASYHQSQYATAPHTPHTPQQTYPQAPTAYTPSQSQQQQQQTPYQPAEYLHQQQQQQQASMQPPVPQQYPAQTFSAPPPYPATPQSGYYGNPPAPVPPRGTPTHYASAHSLETPPQLPRPSMEYSSQGSHDLGRTSNTHIPPLPPAPHPGYSRHSLYAPQPTTSLHSYPQPPPIPQSSQQDVRPSADAYGVTRPAPLEPLHPPSRPAGAHTPLSAKPSFDLPPLNTTMMSTNKLEPASPASATALQGSYYSDTKLSQDTNKRSYGHVFSNRHQTGPLRQGARPPSLDSGDGMPVGMDLSAAADDDDSTSPEFDPEILGMHYRRADGRQILRALPGHA